MNDTDNLHPPPTVRIIEQETAALGFLMASDAKTGSLLRTLAATKPSGKLLELGTGTGLATAWLLDGMDRTSHLTSIDNDEPVMTVARRHLAHDPRVTFFIIDGAAFLETLQDRRFDLIFADTWPGKYDHLDQALQLLKPGGLYIIDDMLPQPSWPDGHAAKADRLISTLEQRADLNVTKLNWSTGLIVASKKA
jgi:predicted O-methyltransferase YrrM